ncbi:subtilisin-like protein [Meredithblackwellia eburnea MCA 4105]
MKIVIPYLLLAFTYGIQAVRTGAWHLVEKRSALPASWKRHRDGPAPRHSFKLSIGLRQSNLDRLDRELLAVSNPDSAEYGKHWKKDQVATFFQPPPATISSVQSWLIGEGFRRSDFRLSRGQTWITVNLTVEEAENLLKTTYNFYEHETGGIRLGCMAYSIPASLRNHIDIITPTLHLKIGQPSFGGGPRPGPAGFSALSESQLANCSTTTTLECLRQLYSIRYTPPVTPNNSFGIVEYTPQVFVPSDFDLFAQRFSPSQVGQRPVLVGIDGGELFSNFTGILYNVESNLDLQYAMGLVQKLPVTLYQTGDAVQGASINNFLDAIDGAYCHTGGGDDPTQDGIYPEAEACGTAPLTNVICTSYGYDEADLTPAYQRRQCQEFAKLGMMGITVVFSSGDNGVAGFNNTCLTQDGNLSQDGTRFAPSWPSTCPYVTSIGATQVRVGGDVTRPNSEIACQEVILSGGGFSDVFAMPSYQKTQVQSFLKKYPPPYSSSQYNTSGSRAYPDLSANGANYAVYIQGVLGHVYGTSASAPVVASMLAMINDARLAIGKSTVGFINPAIYSPLFQLGAFNDITEGGNAGCGTSGFNSTKGWDPVTGLGTPNFLKMMLAFLALP